MFSMCEEALSKGFGFKTNKLVVECLLIHHMDIFQYVSSWFESGVFKSRIEVFLVSVACLKIIRSLFSIHLFLFERVEGLRGVRWVCEYGLRVLIG